MVFSTFSFSQRRYEKSRYLKSPNAWFLVPLKEQKRIFKTKKKDGNLGPTFQIGLKLNRIKKWFLSAYFANVYGDLK